MSETKQVVYTPVEFDGDQYADFAEIKTEEEIDFEKFRDEMRESNQYAKITISRQPTTSDGRPGQQKLIFLFECGMDEFSFSQLCSRCRDEYGTGTYRIQARNEKGQLKINKAIQVEAPKLGELERAQNSPGDIISRMSEAMHQHQIRTESMIERFQGPQNSGDAIDQITKLATAIGPLLTAIGFGGREAPKSFMDQMQEFVTMQTMIKELGDGGGGSGDANLYSLLTATMQSFGAPIAAALAAGQIDGSVNPQGILANPKALAPDHEKIKREQETEALKGQIKILVANAEANTDAVQMANLIVEKTPEESLDSLFEFLSNEDYLEQMIFLVPEVEVHKNWFIKLRDTVLELLTVDDDEPIVAESETVADDTTGPDIASDTDSDAGKDT